MLGQECMTCEMLWPVLGSPLTLCRLTIRNLMGSLVAVWNGEGMMAMVLSRAVLLLSLTLTKGAVVDMTHLGAMMSPQFIDEVDRWRTLGCMCWSAKCLVELAEMFCRLRLIGMIVVQVMGCCARWLTMWLPMGQLSLGALVVVCA